MPKANSLSVAHLAIVAPSLKEALQKVELALGLKASGHVEEVADQKVRADFVEVGGLRIEFLEPTSKDSPISKFIEKRGGGIHHLALYVKDLSSKLAELKAKGVPLIDESPRIGAEGCKVAFLHPKGMNGVLIELIEQGDSIPISVSK